MYHTISQNRLNVFLELLEQGELDKVSVDVDKSDKLIRLLDTVVIKLEGGTEEDLKALDEPPAPETTSTNEKTGRYLINYELCKIYIATSNVLLSVI